MAFYALMTNNYTSVKNKFIFDTADMTVEFAPPVLVRKIQNEYGVAEYRPDLNDEFMNNFAKLALSGNRLELYRDSQIILYFEYSVSNMFWHLCMQLLDDTMMASEHILKLTDNIFFWNTVGFVLLDEARLFYSLVPEYYIGYLLTNTNKIKSEMKNILKHTYLLRNGQDSWYDLVDGLGNMACERVINRR